MALGAELLDMDPGTDRIPGKPEKQLIVAVPTRLDSREDLLDLDVDVFLPAAIERRGHSWTEEAVGVWLQFTQCAAAMPE